MNQIIPNTCPRRAENPIGSMAILADSDHWENRAQMSHGIVGLHCSYCGSFHPDMLMAALEDGKLRIGPTDKDYKIYLEDENRQRTKFYFQHLDNAQKRRFIELLNAKKLMFDEPGHFYVLPFFCTR